MIVRKFSEAKAYEAPNHRDYKSFRVFGAEMGGSVHTERLVVAMVRRFVTRPEKFADDHQNFSPSRSRFLAWVDDGDQPYVPA